KQKTMNAKSIETVAVLGLGTMGHSIAQTFAAAGCKVRCYDEQPQACETLRNRIETNLQRMAEAGVVEADSIKQTLERIEVCPSETSAVEGAEFVTEAVAENLPVKRELFARIESQARAEAILASNSSSFPITEIANAMRTPERAILTHWFNPPHIVPVVEVVPGKRTQDAAAQTTVELLRRIGKLPIRLNMEIPGFLVNRVQMAMYREIWDLLERGIAEPDQIDLAIQGSMGFRLALIGPLEVNDFAGLDVSSRVYQILIPEVRSDTQVPSHIKKLVDAGRLGVKAGKGIYDYTGEDIKRKQDRRDRRYLALIKLLQDDEKSADEPAD
ncbi:MAG: 3-hydroxyacyl-CoA dehydrogenase family protein, partial [Planctomycetes bacterium]|nr:3-hydroxyacyl-CoA dehydrogenase family protein [Planctomycetota bacterium]